MGELQVFNLLKVLNNSSSFYYFQPFQDKERAVLISSRILIKIWQDLQRTVITRIILACKFKKEKFCTKSNKNNTYFLWSSFHVEISKIRMKFSISLHLTDGNFRLCSLKVYCTSQNSMYCACQIFTRVLTFSIFLVRLHNLICLHSQRLNCSISKVPYFTHLILKTVCSPAYSDVVHWYPSKDWKMQGEEKMNTHLHNA